MCVYAFIEINLILKVFYVHMGCSPTLDNHARDIDVQSNAHK